MGNHQNRSKRAVVKIAWAVLPLIAAGCADASGRVYMTTLRNYPGCVTQAQINQAKVGACGDSTDKSSLNACLVSKNVPQSKIDVLNTCVDSHRRSSIGNLF
jgi:hypothetical protein